MKAKKSVPKPQPAAPLPSSTRQRLSHVCLAAGLAVIAIGILVLVGWVFNIEILKRAAPGQVAMNPVTAALFVLSGSALILVRRKDHLSAGRKVLARVAALVTAAIGALNLFLLITGWKSRFELLFPDELDVQTGFLNQMAPNTALNFLLAGCALLLIDTRSRKGHRPSEFLSTTCSVSALLALIGYAYHVPSFYGFGAHIPMALHTAMAFAILSVGILLARTEEGLAAVIASDTAGGIVVRRLLPIAILLPIGLGALALEGGRRGVYPPEFGAVMNVTLLILFFLGLIWWIAVLLYRSDTERKYAEGVRQESEERVRQMAEHIGDTFWMTSLAGEQLLYVSTAYEKIWGRSVDELYENPWQRIDAIHPEDRQRVRDSFVEKAAQGNYAEEFRIVRPNGEERWIAERGYPVRNKSGEVYRIAGIASDVTERKAAIAAVQRAQAEAERANNSKSEFLSRMSHELRTPLNAILGFGQLLELDKLSSEQEESVRHILSAGRHLLELINEVLDISRIETGRLAISLEPVSVPDLLHEIITLVTPLAREREVELLQHAENVDLFVKADRQRLKQVLLNLLSNAIKYNKRAGQVRVETRRERATDSEKAVVRVEVTDSGAGIPADKLDQLFTPFQRLGAEKTDVDGTGLGLALSKRLVELMEGKIGVESAPETGSTFWIEIAAAENPLQRLETTAESTQENLETSTLATVLYIEDNPSNLRLVERILARRPEVRLISTPLGRNGVEMAEKHTPNLILLDLHLPDIHGQEVLKALRANPATNQIPVVIVSADATPGQVQRLKETGAHAYLTKPIAVTRFVKVLEETLNSVATDEPATQQTTN